jgi:protocatechuate 3,4-dioxygenase beta subunit
VVDVNVRLAGVPALVVLVLAVSAACDGGATPPERQPAGSTGPPLTSITPTTAGCARPAAGAPAAGSELTPGPSNGLADSTAVGEPLVIEAVVLDRGCQPAAGADVNLWHADAHGLYGPVGSDRCCYYAGTVRADLNGRFGLSTIRPAQYPVANAPPAHIHLEIRHPTGDINTEIVFGAEPPFELIPPTGNVMTVTLREDGAGWRGEAVFVLSGTT